MKRILLWVALLAANSALWSQQSGITMDSSFALAPQMAKTQRWLGPAALIGYGLLTPNIRALKVLDKTTRDEVVSSHLRQRKTEDFLQWSPLVGLWLLDAAGVQTTHRVKDQLVLQTFSTLLMAGTVSAGKSLFKRERPDGSDRRAFPSGHTATAFCTAEIWHQELKFTHPVLSYAGYAAAGITGALRVKYNHHWLSDVVAGAGVGILSTKLSYWAFEKLKKHPHYLPAFR